MEKTEQIAKRIGGVISTTSTNMRAPHQPGPGNPNCSRCHGVGYLRADLPLGHPNFGRLTPCSCRSQEIEQASGEKRVEVSNLGALRAKTFANFLPEGHATDKHQRESLRQAFEVAYAFAQQPRGWLFISGSYGVGKTHLAAAIANWLLDQSQVVTFVTVPDLLDHLRSTYRPNAEVPYDALFEQVRNVPLLVLDDLGAESPTQWAQEKLYQLINQRYTNQLPTVITSNVELERLEPRIRSRIVDLDLVRKVYLDAPDFRRAESDQPALSSLELHQHQTFENFDLRRSEIAAEHVRFLAAALQAAQQFAAEPHGWLLLTGGHGSGKTHLAAAVANQQVWSGHSALFVTLADLLDHLRATFSPDSYIRYDKRFAEVRNAPLLILDDLSLESATPWAREKLFQLVDYRYLTQLPTVFTTALDRETLDARLQTRLLDPRLTVVCPLTAPIYRGSGKANKPRR
jgi:DNA replication protein DnaC